MAVAVRQVVVDLLEVTAKSRRRHRYQAVVGLTCRRPGGAEGTCDLRIHCPECRIVRRSLGRCRASFSRSHRCCVALRRRTGIHRRLLRLRLQLRRRRRRLRRRRLRRRRRRRLMLRLLQHRRWRALFIITCPTD